MHLCVVSCRSALLAPLSLEWGGCPPCPPGMPASEFLFAPGVEAYAIADLVSVSMDSFSFLKTFMEAKKKQFYVITINEIFTSS